MYPKIFQFAKATLQSSIVPVASYGIFETGRNWELIQNTFKEKYINKNYNQNKFPFFK